MTDGPCTVPPDGWRCTRGNGHDGPCAAIPISQDDGVVMVRVHQELVDRLATEDSEPVVIIGLDKLNDGTYEMVLRTPEVHVGRTRYVPAPWS